MVFAQGVEFHKFSQEELHSLVEDRGNFFPHFRFARLSSKRLVSGKYPKRRKEDFRISITGQSRLARLPESVLAVFTWVLVTLGGKPVGAVTL